MENNNTVTVDMPELRAELEAARGEFLSGVAKIETAIQSHHQSFVANLDEFNALKTDLIASLTKARSLYEKLNAFEFTFT